MPVISSQHMRRLQEVGNSNHFALSKYGPTTERNYDRRVRQLRKDPIETSASFPWKLYHLVENESDEIIAWSNHGQSFRINDSVRFSNEVVPNYFKHTKITSFQRQLNLYGFRRILKGEDQGAYIHPLFQRGRPDLIHEIKRISSKPGDYGHIDTSYDSWPHTTKSATLKPNIKVTNDDDNSSAAQSKSIARMVYDVEARSRATQDTRYQNPSSIVPFKDIQPASNVIFSLNNGSNSLYHNKMSKLSINIGYDKYLSTTKIQTPEISSTNSGTPTSSTAAAVAAQSSFTHTSSSNITSNLQGNHSSTNKYMETRHSTLRHRGSEFSNETISNESSRNESQYDSMDISNNQLFKKPRNHDDIYPITNSNFYNYQNANMKSQNDNVMSCPNVDDDSDLNGLLLESFYDEDFSDLSMVLSEPTELKTDDVLGENANYGVTNNIKRSFSYDEFDNYRLNEFSSFVDFDDL